MKAKNISWSLYLRNGLARRLAMLGERLGQDWLIYNPLVMRQFHSRALQEATLVVPVVIELFPHARTLLDVGCGSGAFAAEFARRGCRVVGLERSPHGRKLAARQQVDCRGFDLLTEPAIVVEKFDLVYCFEVAEHMDQALGDRLVEYLCGFKTPLVFSAAQPGQGGTGHINEQPPEYWIRRFKDRGFQLDGTMTQELRREFTVREAAPWFQRNPLVFAPATE